MQDSLIPVSKETAPPDSFQVLYRSPHIFVCIKPFGVLSEDGASGVSIFSLLRQYCKENGLSDTLYPVHRLDRETGGLMVFARDRETAAFLSERIRNGEMVKEYDALVRGKVEPDQGEWTDLLFHDRRQNKTFVVQRERKGVKKAALAYETRKAENGESLVHIRLLTGRTHQIRIQFAHRGHPLAGDRKYGGSKRRQLALWAGSLRFPAPSGEILRFSAPPPFGEDTE